MRGDNDNNGYMFSYISPERRVPANHPLRRIKKIADAALKNLSAVFDSMYSHTGRPSIPPERLLKGIVLQALYSVRSDRLFCETLDYNMLYRWFLDMSMDDDSFDHSVFTKNRDRLLKHEVAQKFFDEVVRFARGEGLLSDEHFSVDGTLIEAWASMKSFRPKEESAVPSSDDDDSNPTVDFRGEQRGNRTHESKTDPDARLLRKSKGKEAKLCYGFHGLMENRNGLLTEAVTTHAGVKVERSAALEMLDRQDRRGITAVSVGGDKGYHVAEFVFNLCERDIKPHIAQIAGRKTPGLDGRTGRSAGYRLSQKIRKRIEEVFGWMKTVGGMRKTRFRGLERVAQHGMFVATAYNLLRIGRLLSFA